MKEIIAVIGKNFGDEGKGQTVNDLCRRGSALVVRHNGGAQAGHTVEEGDFRFVFHQLGSGSYQGCPTFWAETFLPDLLKLGEEMEALAAFSPITHVHASPDCACTTVYDVLLNSLTETLRGSQKHGSCGMGIFEAVLRGRKEPFRLTLGDLMDWDAPYLLQKLHRIREQYAKPRLESLCRQFPEQFDRKEITGWADLICDDQVLFNATKIMLDNFRKYVIPDDFCRLAAQYDRIIFENAQGLMLDWDNEEYSPHLTASHTGLKNVAALLGKLSRPYSLDVIYVTRAYVTRHGAGRLDHECPGAEINPQMRDATNVPNPWQDALRYARHPRGEDFFRYIRRDLAWLDASRDILQIPVESDVSRHIPQASADSDPSRHIPQIPAESDASRHIPQASAETDASRDILQIPAETDACRDILQAPAETNAFADVPIDSWKLATPNHPGYPAVRTVLRLTHLDETGGRVIFAGGDMSLKEFRAFCGRHAPELIIEEYWRKE